MFSEETCVSSVFTPGREERMPVRSQHGALASPIPWMLLLSSSALLLGAGLPEGDSGKTAPPDPAGYEKQIRPVLQQFCMGCHGGATPSGGLDLTAFHNLA